MSGGILPRNLRNAPANLCGELLAVWFGALMLFQIS